MAREVVEAYGDKIMEHPVGTGPFRLAEWRRSSRIVLERNPDYRDELYDAEPQRRRRRGPGAAGALQGPPAADDRPGRDRRSIEEAQPRWLAFLNGEQDLL